jgi:hypothetical protein
MRGVMIISDNPFAYLFGIYLGQDWPDEYGTWESAVDAFKRENPPLTAPAIAIVEDMLVASPDEIELQLALERVSCAYDPAGGAGGYRTWLQAVRDRLSANGHA